MNRCQSMRKAFSNMITPTVKLRSSSYSDCHLSQWILNKEVYCFLMSSKSTWDQQRSNLKTFQHDSCNRKSLMVPIDSLQWKRHIVLVEFKGWKSYIISPEINESQGCASGVLLRFTYLSIRKHLCRSRVIGENWIIGQKSKLQNCLKYGNFKSKPLMNFICRST